MTFRNKITSILMIILTLGFLNCGNSGTSTIPFNNQTTSGLYVVSSSPSNNSLYVATGATVLTILMSEDVNQNSLNGNLKVFQTVGGQEAEVTGITTSVNGKIITVNGLNLVGNADYQVRMFPGVAGVSGNTLLQGQTFEYFYIDFSTGNNGTLGQSVPGKPILSGITKSMQGTCFGANIQFNESLAYQPLVNIKYYNLGAFSMVTIPAVAFPVISGSTTQWHVDLDPASCSNRGPFTQIFVYVTDYVDLEGLHGDAGQQNFTGIM